MIQRSRSRRFFTINIDMDNSEEINKFKKLDNSKLTDVKVPKQKKIEDNFILGILRCFKWLST